MVTSGDLYTRIHVGDGTRKTKLEMNSSRVYWQVLCLPFVYWRSEHEQTYDRFLSPIVSKVNTGPIFHQPHSIF